MAYVDVIYRQDWGSDLGEPCPEWGDRQAMAEYLAQWDYGEETDAAHTEAGPEPFYPRYTTTEHVVSGLVYRLTTSPLGDAGLTRNPLVDNG